MGQHLSKTQIPNKKNYKKMNTLVKLYKIRGMILKMGSHFKMYSVNNKIIIRVYPSSVRLASRLTPETLNELVIKILRYEALRAFTDTILIGEIE